MPRLVKTTNDQAALILHKTDPQALENALMWITESALDNNESSADTAAVVYEQLAQLGIVVP